MGSSVSEHGCTSMLNAFSYAALRLGNLHGQSQYSSSGCYGSGEIQPEMFLDM